MTCKRALAYLWSLSAILGLALVSPACSDDDGGSEDLCASVSCGSYGQCDPETGLCACDTGYTGDTCEDCDTGYIDDDGVCVEGECTDASDCDDGNACNGTEICDENHQCITIDTVECGENAHCVAPGGTCACDDGYIMEDDTCVSDLITDFEDLTLESESYWNGASGPGSMSSFETGDATLSNFYDDEYSYWEGFAYSNSTDTTTPSFENQYSAIPGGGEADSENYAVGYYSTFYGYPPPTVMFSNAGSGYTVAGLYVTNTTYAYLAMRDGDAVSKQFGGTSGEDPDWFLLTIHGLDTNGQETGTVEFYLADFRFQDTSEDYFIEEWTWVDLSSLGPVAGLQFTLTSSDNGQYGMNTPAYFAIDTLRRGPSAL